MASSLNSNKHLKKNINSSQTLPGKKKKGIGRNNSQFILWGQYFKPAYNLISKPDKDITRKLGISYEYGYKTLQQNITKLNPATYKKNYTTWPSRIYPRDTNLYLKSVNIIHYINTIKTKKIPMQRKCLTKSNILSW